MSCFLWKTSEVFEISRSSDILPGGNLRDIVFRAILPDLSIRQEQPGGVQKLSAAVFCIRSVPEPLGPDCQIRVIKPFCRICQSGRSVYFRMQGPAFQRGFPFEGCLSKYCLTSILLSIIFPKIWQNTVIQSRK